MLLQRASSCLVVVDIQEKLLPVMAEPEQVRRGATALIQAARHLEIPIIATEQYPTGIGSTVPDLAELLPDGAVIEKIHFSAAAENACVRGIAGPGRRQAVVCGIEAHVCVLQSAFGLRAAGFDTFVVADATSSRSPANHAAALDRLQRNGISVVTVEMVIFEWLGRADTPEFRALLPIIKALN